MTCRECAECDPLFSAHSCTVMWEFVPALYGDLSLHLNNVRIPLPNGNDLRRMTLSRRPGRSSAYV